jgi:hypothetical protein
MPKGTKVHNCVNKLKKKMSYGKAIAICQKSTKQNYMTGKKISKNKLTKKRKTHKYKTLKKRN